MTIDRRRQRSRVRRLPRSEVDGRFFDIVGRSTVSDEPFAEIVREGSGKLPKKERGPSLLEDYADRPSWWHRNRVAVIVGSTLGPLALYLVGSVAIEVTGLLREQPPAVIVDTQSPTPEIPSSAPPPIAPTSPPHE